MLKYWVDFHFLDIEILFWLIEGLVHALDCVLKIIGLVRVYVIEIFFDLILIRGTFNVDLIHFRFNFFL